MRNNLTLWFCVHLVSFCMLIAHQLLVSSLEEERRVAAEVCYWLALLGTVAIRGAVLAHSAMYLLFVLSLLPGGGGGKGPRRAGDQPRMPSVFGLLRTAQRVKGSLPLG